MFFDYNSRSRKGKNQEAKAQNHQSLTSVCGHLRVFCLIQSAKKNASCLCKKGSECISYSNKIKPYICVFIFLPQLLLSLILNITRVTSWTEFGVTLERRPGRLFWRYPSIRICSDVLMTANDQKKCRQNHGIFSKYEILLGNASNQWLFCCCSDLRLSLFCSSSVDVLLLHCNNFAKPCTAWRLASG
jgi:hypothetical protein